jgi:hypothetical protein
VPVPLQVRAGVKVETEQVAPTQIVPWMYWRQAPPPLQVPSVPQVPAPVSAHWVVGTGGCPAGTLLHVPSTPVSAHDLHVAVQAVAQQTPCAQMPLAQSVFAVQVVPLGRLVQTFDEQILGEAQSAVTMHDVLHAPEPHT